MTGDILFIMRIVLFFPNPGGGYFWELLNQHAMQLRKGENTVTFRSGAYSVRKNITMKTGYRNLPEC
jgi:hypothetical protein